MKFLFWSSSLKIPPPSPNLYPWGISKDLSWDMPRFCGVTHCHKNIVSEANFFSEAMRKLDILELPTHKSFQEEGIVWAKHSNWHLLAASINLLYNSKVIIGIGSMRKYCFKVPQMMFMSSYTPKFTDSPSETKQIEHNNSKN